MCLLALPRTARQAGEIEALARRLPALRVLDEVVDGPALICASDLVVCGGGTMLREAAALGVPAVSVFPGPHGAVDRWLAREGRATLVGSAEDAQRVRLERRPSYAPRPVRDAALARVVAGICETGAIG